MKRKNEKKNQRAFRFFKNIIMTMFFTIIIIIIKNTDFVYVWLVGNLRYLFTTTKKRCVANNNQEYSV